MTNETWGEPIYIMNGERPEWIQDGELIWWSSNGTISGILSNATCEVDDNCNWVAYEYIRLIASHPYYIVRKYNREHDADFTYWPGGDKPPVDWDAGKTLTRNGTFNHRPVSWRHPYTIGYVRKHSSKRSLPKECEQYVITADKLKVESDGDMTLYTSPQPDRFSTESPIRAFTDWKVDGLYALGKGFRPSMRHVTVYLDAMHRKEGWVLVQILEASSGSPSFLFRREE